MNCKASFNQRFARCMAMVVGFVGIAAATPVLAQQLPHKILLSQMAQTSPSIEGSWRLANMSEDAAPTPMLPSEELTADFSGDRLSGSGGCNRFMGGFKTEGNQLTIEPLASTFKACETPVMNQETKYLTALQGAQRYEVNDQGLQIFYQTAQGSGVLRFTAQTVRALW
jgi:heat shock protein HslJ